MVSKDIKICKICLIVSIDFCALTNFFFFYLFIFIFLKTTKVTSHKLHLPKEKKNRQKIKKESNETGNEKQQKQKTDKS